MSTRSLGLRLGCALLMTCQAALAPHVRAAASISADTREQVQAQIASELADLQGLYKHLHTHPELSLHEEQTARRIGEELGKAGFTVPSGVGGHGVVAVLRNGAGPTVLLRTDLDALPVKEETQAE